MTATIFALSSGAGRAGVALVRISGPAAGSALAALTARALPAPRRARLSSFRDPGTGEILDRGLVLWFPAPHSFTGEDVAELHLHGGRATVAAVLETLGRLPGCAPAEPGAFTRRAFDAGKLDLAEVEGLADLIAAETAAQRRQALRQLDGGLSTRIAAWRDRLARRLAHLEAEIDFPDEDLPERVGATALADISSLRQEMAQDVAAAPLAERLREGLEVAILGAPNAGKSSLLNALARREVAIVAETAGTTRDVLEVRLEVGGYPVTLADTAGLRAAEEGELDPVEREGIRRSRARAEAADLKLLVFDATVPPDPAVVAWADGDALLILSKVDLLAATSDRDLASLDGHTAVPVSVKSGAGIDLLIATLSAAVAERFRGLETAPLTRERHRAAVTEAVAALQRAESARLPELAAEDLRLALRALGRIVGAVDVEDLLGLIFCEFCIGK